MPAREGEHRPVRARRWRATLVAVVTWLVFVAAVGLQTLLTMRECVSPVTANSILAIGLAALVASLFLALTGRGSAGRLIVVVVAAWAAYFAVFEICNLPSREEREYYRKLDNPPPLAPDRGP